MNIVHKFPHSRNYFIGILRKLFRVDVRNGNFSPPRFGVNFSELHKSDFPHNYTSFLKPFRVDFRDGNFSLLRFGVNFSELQKSDFPHNYTSFLKPFRVDVRDGNFSPPCFGVNFSELFRVDFRDGNFAPMNPHCKTVLADVQILSCFVTILNMKISAKR